MVRRLLLLSRIQNDPLRRAAEAIFDLADEVGTRRAALEKDIRFTAEGKAAQIADALAPK